MGIEIERKFLLVNDDWRKNAQCEFYRQGYLCVTKERTIRIRVAGDFAFITIKGESYGTQRKEFEYAIPVSDANELLNSLCLKPLIEKKRYKIYYRNLLWEIDEFLGDNSGLILAEVELEQPDQKILLPDWIGFEVTGDAKYYNANLVANPFKNW